MTKVGFLMSFMSQILFHVSSQKAPTTEELVIFGFAPTKLYVVVGIISADGKKLVHKVDIKLNRCSLCHDIGVTQRLNMRTREVKEKDLYGDQVVYMDFPMINENF
ncbi:hypothetical protein RYX36_004213, partial [Vicia faba]